MKLKTFPLLTAAPSSDICGVFVKKVCVKDFTSMCCEPGSTRIFTLFSFYGLLFSPVYGFMVITIRCPLGLLPLLSWDIHGSILGRQIYRQLGTPCVSRLEVPPRKLSSGYRALCVSECIHEWVYEWASMNHFVQNSHTHKAWEGQTETSISTVIGKKTEHIKK